MAVRERRCAATGETRPETALIRLAVAPDGMLTPDLAAKLPGRGVWVGAERALIERAVAKGLLVRAAKGARAPEGLADRIEALLARRALSLLGLARRSGDLVLGADSAKAALKSARPAWRIEASDGAADGRRRLDALALAAWGGVPVAGCFTSAELGAAVGYDGVVHAVMTGGAQARAFGETMDKLAGFRAIAPFDAGGM